MELEIKYNGKGYWVQGDFYEGEFDEPDETNYCNELIAPYFEIDHVYSLDDDGEEIDFRYEFGLSELKEIEEICINTLL